MSVKSILSNYLYYNGLTRVNVTGGLALELSVVIQNLSVSWTFFISVCLMFDIISVRLDLPGEYVDYQFYTLNLIIDLFS